MLKDNIKTHFQSLYDIARFSRDTLKNRKKKKLLSNIYNACHTERVKISTPLDTIMVNDGPKRLNIIFDSFTEKSIQKNEVKDLLKNAVAFSKKENYALRIISRNNLPNPKFFNDFLVENNLEKPEKYSFYTDCADRVSNSVRRLEISKNDIFFSESENKLLKEWIKDEEK